jgi:hypothetical protein
MREDDWASEPTYSGGGASPARRYYAASEPLEPWPLAEWLVQHLIPFAKKAAQWAGRQVWRAACWSWPVVCRLAGRVRRAAIEAPRRPQADEMLRLVDPTWNDHKCPTPGGSKPPGVGSVWRCGTCGKLWEMRPGAFCRYWQAPRLVTRVKYRKTSTP